MTNCVVTGNTANSNGGVNGGGGIYCYATASTLTLQGTTVSSNSASGLGGGINTRYTSSIIIQNSTIANNTCSDVGGGLYAHSGTLLLANSAVTGNSSGGGGGLFLPPSYTPTGLTIRNCTITNNKSSGSGGAILSVGGETLLVQNSTITGNTAVTNGGGFAQTYHSCTLNIESSVVSGNINANAPDIFRYGYTTVNAKNCAIGSSKGFTLTDQGGNLPFGTNLKLGPLANNGGPTMTELPALDSPLLNAGSNPASITFDQRGFARTANGKTDIGAVEVPIVSLVTNTADSGAGSLRQAIINSNGLSGTTGLIQFDPTLFATAQTITLTGEIAVTNGVTIVGPGSNLLTINGNLAGRIFDVNGGVGSLAVSISGLTLTGGKTSSSGGAIFDQDEALTLTDCVLTANTSSQAGGAIFVQAAPGSLNLQRCTISNNQVTAGVGQKAGDGGAIDVIGSASVSIDSCSITGNTAKEAGGGLYFFSGGAVSITNSTLSGNWAKTGNGGGMYFMGAATAVTLRGSTLSGNSAQLSGGGIALVNFTGTATIQNTTITANTATTGNGGGIARLSGSGSIMLESSIASGNSAVSANDIYSTGTVAAKTSAIGDSVGFTFTNNGGNLPFAANLKIGPLANNGGLTQTHLPQPTSALINAGSNPAGLTTDQRGLFRTVLGQADIGSVETQDLVVTSTADSGSGSLRQAVLDANTLFTGPNTITFDAAAFATAKSITLTSGEIVITEALSIQGPGAALVSVSGNNAGRIFNIDVPNSSGNAIALSGMKLTAGKASTTGGGAIIDADEALVLSGMVIDGNQSSVTGGGVLVQSAAGSLSVQNSTLSNNSVTAGTGLKLGDGGAISLLGASAVTIDRSTLSGNSANENGGAIYFYLGGSLALTNSTVSGNTAKTQQGGGLFFYGTVTAGGLLLRNSTFSANTAQTSGGGVNLGGLTGNCVVQNCTFTNNKANTLVGGGIARISGSGTISLESSIISGNTNVNAPDIYSYGNASAKFCAIGSTTGLMFTDQGNNLIGANLKLGPLADNGGPTLTNALLPGSPCIDAGSNPALLATDQRGFARTVGAGTDIGAFEVQIAHVLSVVINGGAAQRSLVTSIAVTFDELVSLPADPAAAFHLLRQRDSATIGLAGVVSGATQTTVTLSFSGPATDFASLADGRYTLSVLANQVSGGNFDGNGDGVAGDDYTLVGTPANGLFRLYGDADGNGTVDSSDFAAFRLSFLQASTIFDFDGNGLVDAADFLQFRLRFLQMI